MKFKDIRSIVDLIRDASRADLIIISLILLPILLGSWSIFLNDVGYFDKHNEWKLGIMTVVIIIYVLALIVMKCWDPHDEKLKRACLHVKHRLERRKGNRASFEAIREEVNQEYSNAFLEELIDNNPETFRTVRVKRGGEYLPGITLIEDEIEKISS